jgi:excisionase family DNA binding protein
MRLDGMKEICNYMRRSEDTVLRMVRFQDMPAAKLGGIWFSDTESIDKWVKGVAEEVRVTRGGRW